jgi:hypothetical protein
VKHICTAEPMKTTDQTEDKRSAVRQTEDKRSAVRRPVTLPARLTWKDQRGATRFTSVTAKNVSEFGVYVECQSPVPIGLFRLVQFQLERDVRDSEGLPRCLRQGRVLSAVYRVAPKTNSNAHGLALRLLVEPRRNVETAAAMVEQTRATA